MNSEPVRIVISLLQSKKEMKDALVGHLTEFVPENGGNTFGACDSLPRGASVC